MERPIFKQQKFNPSESVTYHFGDNKIIQGTRRPEIELNPAIFNNKSQEDDDDQEEKEMEFDCMQPKIKKEEEEEDPLKIDDIKPDISNLETDNKLKRVVLLIANRRNELVTTDTEQKPKKRKGTVSNKKACNNGSVEKKLNNSSESSKKIQSIVNNGRKKYTGYTLWRKETRIDLQKVNSDKTFREISIILDQKWKKVPPHEKFQYRVRAKEVNDKMIRTNQGKKDVVKTVKTISPPVEFEEDKKISRKGRVISKPTKLADFYKSHLEKNEKDSFRRTKKQSR
ncbi:FACT complex subunit SSRP1-like [Leptopilina heterotoma]|uniref:FACT complex subunit SSRP1-like n=1 Tax=Leptopilina heterotoma TaxID=63436 RepID=UPI001CA94555|nr:FACT complex subunit SSRP1-like [Leptopilina heterotoma]XP_043475589.1 FACT complex subunit SSRP1-like [Leptopilina heterotoma]